MSRAVQKILYLQLFVPFFCFSQGLVNCSLLTVADVIIQNDSITFEIYNADNMDTHYPFIEYTCELLYNPSTKVINKEIYREKILLKTIDILGREVKKGQNKILIDILDDGSSNKRFVLEKIDWI